MMRSCATWDKRSFLCSVLAACRQAEAGSEAGLSTSPEPSTRTGGPVWIPVEERDRARRVTVQGENLHGEASYQPLYENDVAVGVPLRAPWAEGSAVPTEPAEQLLVDPWAAGARADRGPLLRI